MIRTEERGTLAVIAAEAEGEGRALERAIELAQHWGGPVALVLTCDPEPDEEVALPPNVEVVAAGGDLARTLGHATEPLVLAGVAEALLKAATRRGRLEQAYAIVGSGDVDMLPAFSSAAFPAAVEVELLDSAGLPEAAWLWEHADGVVLADDARLYQLASGQPALPVRVVPPGVEGEQPLWREHPAFGARPRVSVVVPVHGAAAEVRRTADAVLACTPGLLELILVEDASPDATLAQLERVAAREPRVRLLVNREPCGFAASANRGLAAARGDLVVLLAPGAVVTPEWAARLRFHLLVQPRAGACGPVSNRVPGLQQLAPVDYDERSLEGLEAFAERTFRGSAAQARGVVRLSSTCLALARPALRRVGGFDPRFHGEGGAGQYEDDDWCLRLIAAGLVPYCADDVFLHHEGPRGAAGRPDLDGNWSRFRTKWGLPADRPRERHYSPEELTTGPFRRQRDFIAPWVAVEPIRS